jgi:hypothetical protein
MSRFERLPQVATERTRKGSRARNERGGNRDLQRTPSA